MNAKGILAALAVLLLGGCAYNYGPASYNAHAAMGEQSVRYGVVESVREVKLQLRQTGVGSASGAMVGSVAGSYAGNSYHGSGAGFVIGALLGALIGNEIERSANERPGVELNVLLDSGSMIAVVQDAEEPFRAGDRVRVLSGRGLTRVTH
jgi:outer membrane lipoprotein SlyB